MPVEFRWLPTVVGAALLCVGLGYVALGLLGGHLGLSLLGFGVLVALAGVVFLRIGRGASAKWTATILGIVLLLGGVIYLVLGTVGNFDLGTLVRGSIFTGLAVMLLRYARGAHAIPFRPGKHRQSGFL